MSVYTLRIYSSLRKDSPPQELWLAVCLSLVLNKYKRAKNIFHVTIQMYKYPQIIISVTFL